MEFGAGILEAREDYRNADLDRGGAGESAIGCARHRAR